jgi:murein endopeptidase
MLAPLTAVVAVLLVVAAAVYATGDPGGGTEPPSPEPPVTTTTQPEPPPPEVTEPEAELELIPAFPRVRWRRSVALGLPWSGRLVNGVQLPREGELFITWDPVLRRSPNRHWRRWGTDRLVRLLLRVLAEQRDAYPDAPRIAIGDLSRPRGGDFGKRFGSIGHASHQNGLDADVYYPRRDGRERRADLVRQVDLELAQDLVTRLASARIVTDVFVGPATGLVGPRKKVGVLEHHDDHLHVRIRPPSRHR